MVGGSKKDIIILGGGLAGLASGHVLTKSGYSVSVIERDAVVGGLSKTIEKNGFRFDLGGHRFHTRDQRIDAFVRELMEDELVYVRRSSKIYMRDKYFNYPLKPLNAMFGLGIATTLRIVADYARESLMRTARAKEAVSLEEWVIANFGRTMFDLYFKEYSEKVWGIDCGRISADWVAQRIKGLSLASAIKNAFFKFSGRELATLADGFLYPALGIGRMSERMKRDIEQSGEVLTGARIVAVNHDDGRIKSATVRHHGRDSDVSADEYISSLPLTTFVQMLDPAPPGRILDIAARIQFRDLVAVAIMIGRERVTDQTWIYVPERKVPFGRIHEPTNWSPAMAPPGKSLLVMEYFSFLGDSVWNMGDDALAALTVDHLVRLGFISGNEVLDSMIVRVPHAYPLFEVGYREFAEELLDYLGRFENLHSTGRSGLFRYYNMDAALRSGIETAETVMRKALPADAAALDEFAVAGVP